LCSEKAERKENGERIRKKSKREREGGEIKSAMEFQLNVFS